MPRTPRLTIRPRPQVHQLPGLEGLRRQVRQRPEQPLADPGHKFKDPTLAKVAELNKSSMGYLMLVHFRYQEPTGSVLEQAAVQKLLAGKQTPAEAGAEITKGIATYYAPFKK